MQLLPVKLLCFSLKLICSKGIQMADCGLDAANLDVLSEIFLNTRYKMSWAFLYGSPYFLLPSQVAVKEL